MSPFPPLPPASHETGGWGWFEIVYWAAIFAVAGALGRVRNWRR